MAFTNDEEVGAGADLFDLKAFGADYAYTMDDGDVGELDTRTSMRLRPLLPSTASRCIPAAPRT